MSDVRKLLGAFYKTVDVMKSARNSETKTMNVWADDMKAVEDVMFFLENLRDAGPAATAVTPDTQEQLAEAGRGAIAIRNELDRVRVDLYQAKDEALRWKAQFDSASAAASEYSEFWEQHSGEFDSFGNYIPHSQIDGDLRSAKVRIAELEALVSRPLQAPGGGE